MKKAVWLFASVMLLSACSTNHAVIIPQQNNTYSSVAHGREALKDAVGKANQVCNKLDKKLVVLNREERRSGDGMVLSVAKSALDKYVGTQFKRDSVTLLFRCE